MLSLLTRRVSVSLATRFVVLAPLTRRNFLTTPQLQFPPLATKAKKATGSDKPKKESPRKKSTKEPKEPTKARGKSATTRVNKDDLPPKRPTPPYFLFLAKFRKDIDSDGSLNESSVVEITKRGGEVWASLTQAEKQRYYDEYEVLRSQHIKAREKYFNELDPSVLKAINKQRKARGKPRIRGLPRQPAPLTPYMRFAVAFRSTDEGNAILQDRASSERPMLRLGRAAGERWRSMSDEEKYPYFVAFKRDKEELQAGQRQESV
ncbi:high mobility group box domain-containing protein [Pisolithus croceorrhizus]|nr:high mobility group box domain-containing protein [Pisolithus croceorrhizus]KAI6130974.1 high mobility group box domain-containing protein [Pisolithus croceorrhizus]